MDNLKYWVWITQTFGAGNNRIWEIVNHCEDIKAVYEALKQEKSIPLTPMEQSAVDKTSLLQADEMIRYCSGKEYRILCFEDEGYPERLQEIYNPPPILFCMGDLSYIDDEVVITVVGTRHPSDYSVKLAKKICDELAKVGVTLVSGFALGIDSMAHQAALKNNARTVAVLGSGIDFDYPKENSAVKKVLAKKGAVISEFFPGTRPDGKNFPLRNRIMSGLSLGTLVIEAGVKSGSLITADLALQQGRDLFCVPPADLFDERYMGQTKFLRDGAIPAFSHLDIIYEYYENFAHKINSIGHDNNYTIKEDSIVFGETTSKHEKSSDSGLTSGNAGEDKIKTSIPSINYNELTEEQAQIVRLLEQSSLLADEIAEQSGMDVDQVLSLLTELELYGVVQAQAGKRYSL